MDTDRTYTGQVSDETLTGLMFYNARYYDPLLRRFISPDTIVPDPGDPQSLNRYSYVRNNPVNRADPSGHFDYATPKIDGGVCAGTWDDCTANERKVRNEAAEMRSAGFTTKEMAMRWGGRITDNRDMGTSNWDDLLLGPFRFLVFDERECTGSGSAASCATQIAGILPWGKALKLLRFTDELVDGVHLSDEFADGGRHAGDAAGAVCSFSGDTEVVMGDGTTKSIEQVKIGDEVVAHDPETGDQGNRRVSHVWVHDDTLVELNIGGEVLVTTEDHPFWNATDKAWQRADILDPGDRVLAIDGTTLPVVGLDWTTTRNDTAYNLAIEEIHTYYVEVGGSTVLVHNVCSKIKADKRLVKEAGKLGSEHQRKIDAMTAQLNAGNLNPGISTKVVFGDVLEARAKNGARVYFQNKDGVVTIVGKSNKHNQGRVIAILKELYG